MRTTIAFVLATLFCQSALADRGYDRFRKLRVQADLYEGLGRPARAADALVEAFEAFPDESVLLDAAAKLRSASEHERAILVLERYLTVSRSPAGRVQAKDMLGSIRADLGKTAAEVRVITDPVGAEVCIDDDVKDCKSSPVRTWLTAGKHTLRIHQPGLASRTHVVNIDAGRHTKIEVTLQPRVPAGRLEVFARNPKAQVKVDNKPIGQVPVTGHPLPAGPHVVEVDNGNNEIWRGKVTAEAGRTSSIYAGVAPAPVPAVGPVPLQPTRLITPEPVVVRALDVRVPGLSTPLPERRVDAANADAGAVAAAPVDIAAAPEEPEGSGVGTGGRAPVPVILPTPTPASPTPTAPPVEPPPIEQPPIAQPVEPPPVEPPPLEPIAQPVEPPPVDQTPTAPVEPPPVEPATDPIAENPNPIEDPDPLEDPDPIDDPQPIDDPDPIEDPGTIEDPGEPSSPPENSLDDPTLIDGAGPRWMPITGWTAVGVGVGALGGAIATSVLTQNKVDDIKSLYNDPNATDAQRDQLRSEAKDLQTATNILYPVGGAFVAAGVTLLVLDMMSGPDETTLGDTLQLGAMPLRDGGMMLQTTIEF